MNPAVVIAPAVSSAVAVSSADCNGAGECLILFGITTGMICFVAALLIGGATLYAKLRDRS